ncbi:MAG: type II toxin-antitoxin system RelE/ParE family toxin [Trichlorobacter sp.]|jgi:proteic killer suppression protein|nr:type II toxin-antitoxin system RelE/ParE family toxin [Trichlorobacter sp.]
MSFADKTTEQFYTTGRSKKIPAEIISRAEKRLHQLDMAVLIDDIRNPPSNRLEALLGSRKGQWSVRINNQWRLCFRFENNNAWDVEITDYH